MHKKEKNVEKKCWKLKWEMGGEVDLCIYAEQEDLEISKKRSYTPSYTHYPQKKGEKYRFT